LGYFDLSANGWAPPWGPPNWGAKPADVATNINLAAINSASAEIVTVDEAWAAAVQSYTFALFFLPDPQLPNPPS
jgi:hypothetical protein